MRRAYVRRRDLVSGIGRVDKDAIFGTEDALTGVTPVELALEFSWPANVLELAATVVTDPESHLARVLAAEWQERFVYFPPQPWDQLIPYVEEVGKMVRVRWLAGAPSVDGRTDFGPPWGKRIVEFYLDRSMYVRGADEREIPIWPMDHVAAWRFTRYTPIPMAALFAGFFMPIINRAAVQRLLTVLPR